MRFGIQDRFIEHGKRDELLELCGLTSKQIAEKIFEKLRGEDDIKIYNRTVTFYNLIHKYFPPSIRYFYRLGNHQGL